MTKLCLCGLVLVVTPVLSMAEMGTGAQSLDLAECYSLPESLQTIVEAMDEPGQNMRALAVREKRMPLIPMQPIVVRSADEFHIEGVLIGVIRHCEI